MQIELLTPVPMELDEPGKANQLLPLKPEILMFPPAEKVGSQMSKGSVEPFIIVVEPPAKGTLPVGSSILGIPTDASVTFPMVTKLVYSSSGMKGRRNSESEDAVLPEAKLFL